MGEFDRVENNRAAGAIGGKATTPEKRAASKANLARARQVKDYYRRYPEKRPSRHPQPSNGDDHEAAPR